MSNLSFKDYNLSRQELTNQKHDLELIINNYIDDFTIAQKEHINNKIKKFNEKIKDLETSFEQIVSKNFQRTKGFKINHEEKLQELDDVIHEISDNITKENLTLEERQEIFEKIDKLLERRTKIQEQQQKQISGRGKNRKRKITKKRKHKKKRTKKRKPKNKFKTKKR